MNNMDKMKKKTKSVFITALMMTIGFIVGIPCIVFGAVNQWWILMALGIALALVGFYGMPLVWVKYGNMRRRQAYLAAICEDGILDLQELAETFRVSIQNARQEVEFLMVNRFLVGYAVKNDKLENTADRKKRVIHKCPYCGTIAEKGTTKCPNCNAVLTAVTVTEE